MFEEYELQLSAVNAATKVAAILSHDVFIFSDLTIGTDPNKHPQKRILEIVRYRPDDLWEVD